jgi:hypothetical protein
VRRLLCPLADAPVDSGFHSLLDVTNLDVDLVAGGDSVAASPIRGMAALWAS